MASTWNDPEDYERDPDVQVSGTPYNPHNCPREQILSDALESLEHAWVDVRAALRARRNDGRWPQAERSEFHRLMNHGNRLLKDLQHASHAI